MKKVIILALLLSLLPGMAHLHARNIRALMNYTIFNVPSDGPYIETYLSVSGESVVYKKNDKGNYQAVIEVTFIFRQGEEIKEFDKYQLFSPEVYDSAFVDFDFIDQQRYFMPEGSYELEIQIADLNAGKKPFSTVQPIEILFDKENVTFSGIQLVESATPATEQNILTKGGYDLVPMVSNFYPENISRLIYYTEIYNTGKRMQPGERFLVVTKIKSFETGNPLKDFVHYRKMDAGEVVPVLNEYDISRLPSGNYTLVVEIRNKTNQLVGTNELFFQRSNPNIQFEIKDLASIDVNATFVSRITSNDTIQELLQCLVPVATDLEKNFILKQSLVADLRTKQQFFYNFWLARDTENPEKAWKDYYEMVLMVNAAYKTPIHKGYESDRGRVYLKYGPPNIISESYNEPSSYPYEIWHYYELGDNQRNKKFVFYTHDLITNNFELLHSDAIGEISNYRWNIILNKRWYDPYNVDAQQSPNVYGGKAEDYYRNPR